MIRPFEPNLVKAAWNVFGDSYRYRQQYNEYKAKRMAEEKRKKEFAKGQMSIMDLVKETE